MTSRQPGSGESFARWKPRGLLVLAAKGYESSDGPRLVEAANPRELREAIENPATWPWPQRKFQVFPSSR